MSPLPMTSPIPAIRRIVACTGCGGRRRTLVDSPQHGLRAHCLGCGAEVSFPFATEAIPAIIGRARQVLATA